MCWAFFCILRRGRVGICGTGMFGGPDSDDNEAQQQILAGIYSRRLSMAKNLSRFQPRPDQDVVPGIGPLPHRCHKLFPSRV
jgi:hypothetical protein